MQCPRCAGQMRAETLVGHHGQPITIDICLPCQSMWFDGFESLRLSPGSTLRLFALIGEHAAAPVEPHSDPTPCPRCGARMHLAHDLQRNTRFEYLKCPAGHGRLTSFYNFLREKNFIRPITPDQLKALRAHVHMLHCSNCGGPIDLAAHSSCPHCSSPLSLIDMQQAGTLIAQLQQPGPVEGVVDPALPLNLERARRDTHAAFDAFEADALWYRDASSAGLIGAGIHAIARWLKQRV